MTPETKQNAREALFFASLGVGMICGAYLKKQGVGFLGRMRPGAALGFAASMLDLLIAVQPVRK